MSTQTLLRTTLQSTTNMLPSTKQLTELRRAKQQIKPVLRREQKRRRRKKNETIHHHTDTSEEESDTDEDLDDDAVPPKRQARPKPLSVEQRPGQGREKQPDRSQQQGPHRSDKRRQGRPKTPPSASFSPLKFAAQGGKLTPSKPSAPSAPLTPSAPVSGGGDGDSGDLRLRLRTKGTRVNHRKLSDSRPDSAASEENTSRPNSSNSEAHQNPYQRPMTPLTPSSDSGRRRHHPPNIPIPGACPCPGD